MDATAETQNNAKATPSENAPPARELLAILACVTFSLVVIAAGIYRQTSENDRRSTYASEKELKALSECAKAEARFYAEGGAALTIGHLESIEAKCKRRADEIAQDREGKVVSQAQAQALAAEASPVQQKPQTE